MLTDYQTQVNITTADECWLKIDTSLQVHTILRLVKHFIYLLKNFIRFRHEAASAFLFSFCQQSAFFLIFTMASKFDSSLELSHFDQGILRIVWRNEKGHIGNTWRQGFFYKKGHGAAPFYFSLDKTLGQLEPNFFLFLFFFLNCKIHQYRIEYNNIMTYKTSYNLYSKVQLNLLTIFSSI